MRWWKSSPSRTGSIDKRRVALCGLARMVPQPYPACEFIFPVWSSRGKRGDRLTPLLSTAALSEVATGWRCGIVRVRAERAQTVLCGNT